ncbi:hypothetical protein LXA43DRAFT_905708 [Ganoderma leucocontextum]|nr:hypothetical protein LXA43DRAFT_905708 [Ganoderma leucocontextum]
MADSDSEHSPITSIGCSQLPYFTTDVSCHHCGKGYISKSTARTPLKQCTGCAVALYCNRDCQRAAWAEHKIFCRSKEGATTSNIGHEELGYTTPLSLLYDVKEWARIHSYTLITIMHIALHTKGGVDHNLAAPHTMVFILESVANDSESDHSGHVSTAFRILDARISHKDALFSLKPHWDEDWIAKCERALALWREFITDPALAGAFPITFIVLGTGGVSYHFYDVYRPLRHPVDASPDPLTRLAFDDLDLLCRLSDVPSPSG